MAEGWVRAWDEDLKPIPMRAKRMGSTLRGAHRRFFRKGFTTELKDDADENAGTLETLIWSDWLELPNGLSDDEWTAATFESANGPINGFVRSAHIAEIKYVRLKRPDEIGRSKPENRFKATLHLSNGEEADLLWGDMVQIIERVRRAARTGQGAGPSRGDR